MPHAYEAIVLLRDAGAVIESAIGDLERYCRGITRYEGHYELDFETATATIRVEDGSLLIRVLAEVVVDNEGSKALIVSHIHKHAKCMPANLLWVAGSDEPFDAIVSRNAAKNDF
ncbi:hypothetical protein [Mesorhizobium sp. CAU 1732]|uniref:hypothetical protein n=1 Tax=Mesorhizobium sp. CAU 1732 TaxID=3140358 RepID=UPI0032619CBD